MTNNVSGIVKTRRPGHMLITTALLVFSLLSFLCFFSANWYVSVYGRIGFDSVLFTLTSDLGGVQSGLIVKYLLNAALPTVLCTAVLGFLLFFPWKTIRFLPPKRWICATISLALSVVLLVHGLWNVELPQYIIAQMQSSAIFETEYRDPNRVSITFPEQKRNLVYIMLESMEVSYLSKDMGGAIDYNLIPELTQLAQDNINFSHNESVGGFREVTGSGWTIGAMVSQTSGVPLKTPSTLADRFNGYGKNGEFLPGLTTLGDILHENGYNQALMVGSDAGFGGRKTYYSTHGTDKIYDHGTAQQDGIIENGYHVWWGMEDEYLFRYAKQKILEMAADDAPFAFTMLTVDTHHIGGYKCSLCGNDHKENYENVIRCASRQVAQFLAWLQQQPFYENTTVIIAGDHRSMDNGYFTRNVEEGYERHIYNCFINAAATPVATQNRDFTTLDLFPTTLAAMGCTIEGNRLGLGTNLFSNVPTLAEAMGYDTFSAEVAKDSDFYTRHFFTKN